MTTTLGKAKAKLIRLLGDIPIPETSGGEPLTGDVYSAELLTDGIHAALDALTIKCFKLAELEIDAAATSEELPEDIIEVQSVLDKTAGVFLEKIIMKIGATLTPRQGNGWYLSPTGSISFAAAIGDAGAIVYYSAFWEKPEDDEDELETPNIATTALLMYAASYCMLNTASQAASIRQFNTKVDSGKPTDNPAENMSTFFMKRFEHEMQQIPITTRGANV